MDLYGLSEARSQGNSSTKDVELFNERIKEARDNINNTLDAEQITAQGNLRGQEGQDLQDKLIYDFHDAISGGNVASSLNRYYQTFKTTADTVSDTVDKAKNAYGQARAITDNVAKIATNTVNQVQGAVNQVQGTVNQVQGQVQGAVNQVKGAVNEVQGQVQGAVNQVQGQVKGAVNQVQEGVGQLNNRPKTNEPVSANENTPEVPEGNLSATEELSQTVLNKVSQAKTAVSKIGSGLRVVGDVGGAVSTYEMFKNGLAKNKDGTYDIAGDVGQVATSIGTGLDIIGAIIPGAGAGIEALGAVVQGVGQIASTIDTHNKDEEATQDAQNEADNIEKTRSAQLSALPSAKPISATVNTMASSGLVGSLANHLSSVGGGGTF